MFHLGPTRSSVTLTSYTRHSAQTSPPFRQFSSDPRGGARIGPARLGEPAEQPVAVRLHRPGLVVGHEIHRDPAVARQIGLMPGGEGPILESGTAKREGGE